MNQKSVRDALLGLARKAGFAAEAESLHLLDHSPDTLGRRPADVLIKGWEGDTDMCLDVSVVNPATDSAIRRWPESATKDMEDKKIRESAALCRQNGLLFLPVVMETYGGLGPKAMVAVRRLGKALAQATEDGDVGRAINDGGTKLAFGCQKGLARSFYERYTCTAYRPNNNTPHRALLGAEDDEEGEENGAG